ncbi:MAG: rod shape-determining protein RodA [Gammaproteobacteria bacterium]|nr:rod shape-determining protein RodA [Gammaproteobacteria bacterium]MAY03579.1 rod shape-determining protein RodA [Gammaproteobacteria bacterium]
MGLEKRVSIWERLNLDLPLLFALAVLVGFGLMVLYSATDGNQQELRRQSIFIAVAFLVMFIVAQIDVRVMRRWAPLMYLFSLGLLVAVLFIGSSTNGAQRWLDLPGLPRFQPSEIMKIVLPLTLAAYFSRRAMPPRFKHIFWALVLLALPAVLIAIEPDLGTALLIAVSGIFVLLLAGISWKLVSSALGAGILSIPALWIFYLQEYQKMRILTFLNPENDPLGAGWNIIQSKTAIGSGGLYGKGWLNGVQSRLDFLPEGQTDFIVAVLAEEFGLSGMLFLLMLYLVVIGRGLYIAAVSSDMFTRLLAGSITLTFFVYVFVNIGMVSGILPVVGVPLPLVSLGGTSIVTLMLGFGILMSIHSHGKTAFRYVD